MTSFEFSDWRGAFLVNIHHLFLTNSTLLTLLHLVIYFFIVLLLTLKSEIKDLLKNILRILIFWYSCFLEGIGIQILIKFSVMCFFLMFIFHEKLRYARKCVSLLDWCMKIVCLSTVLAEDYGCIVGYKKYYSFCCSFVLPPI